ncbi:MAG TPA: type II secretion system major pseudopilin GspG [Candidatus Omnitrophota bacterium]|nr:type II secretion system major pseudopilin GspG [Candidatus Omnitrophota bacterium]
MKIYFTRAFTMIEMMLVVIMMGVLAAIVVPNLAGRSQQARVLAAQVDIEASLATALDLYQLDRGFYPTTEEGLGVLITRPEKQSGDENWNGPYLRKKKNPLDPWGRPYQYRSPGEHHPESYDIFSLGPDGIESKDDIKNWE